ncbi:DoxX family protein [Subtercola boreus]|uniref:DoxX family protein n=1 Tax=Subtercola boreus TaxID=120213 RepID=A0A3E0VGL1_9MICO|nr:DoxX family membrane protein [Subtercola boreus]RFA08510.1 DoxX family protein [Subtercola boreus]TQL54565.1 putative oxidoreductase [Subtercola boreus]
MPTSSPTPAAVIAQTVFRVGLGAVLVAHGSQKLFGWFGGGGVEGTAKGMHSMGFRPGRRNAVLAGLGEAGAGAALALGLATPAAGAAAATTMGVAASVHVPNGFFATKGGLEYPAVLALAAAAFSQAGPGPVSLDAATRNVFNRPWMRVVALLAIPVAIGSQVYLRRKELAADAAASDELDSVGDAAALATPDKAE